MTKGKINAFTLPIHEYIKQSPIIGTLWKEIQHRATEDQTLSKIASKDSQDSKDPKASGNITIICGASSDNAISTLAKAVRLANSTLCPQISSPTSTGFTIRTLPSRHRNLVTIQFISLAAFEHPQPLTQTWEIDRQLETKFADELSKYAGECAAGGRDGYDYYRAINLHACFCFTVEQHATFFTYSPPESTHWSGVLISDIGRDPGLHPWNTNKEGYIDAEFFDAHCTDFNLNPGGIIRRQPSPFESRKIDGTAMPVRDQELCVSSPFAFVCDLLVSSSLGWIQVLGFLRSTVERYPEDETLRVKMLGRDKGLVDRAICYFDETIVFLDSAANFGPGASKDEGTASGVSRIAYSLKQDFATLRSEAKELSSIYRETLEFTMTRIGIRSAQQSLLEGKRIQLVTYMAFIFVPVTLVASVFGMNVRELENTPSIKLFWIISIPLTVVSVTLLIISETMWKEFKQFFRPKVRCLKVKGQLLIKNVKDSV